MSQDYYETLQVHPRADQDAIEAAYERLRDLYDLARLDGAAEELTELARQKRDAIERAYAVLGDPTRRAAYDGEQAAQTTDHRPPTTDHQDPETVGRRSSVVGRREQKLLDYRPLPPARRAERARDFNAYPLRQPAAGRQASGKATSRWVAPLAFAGMLALIVAISLGMTSGGASPAAPPAAGP